VVGAKPVESPSLADSQSEFRAIVAELWSGTSAEHRIGLGRVIADRSIADALALLGVPPDITFTKPSDAGLLFIHRALPAADIYFINNSTPQTQVVDASFRISGKVPELWRADTGAIEQLSFQARDGRTIVPLKLDPHDAVFVVFRESPGGQDAVVLSRPVVPERRIESLATLEGPWEVSFPPDLGAPAHARFERLTSWTESLDAGVRYFSGTATYEKTVVIKREELMARERVLLDLGAVKNLAEVIVNSRSLGVLWKAPFKLDITDALQPGNNRIEINVTNLWPNRLIGDRQANATAVAFTTFNPYSAASPLLASGLLGPVVLQRAISRPN
jgi:hypothetical protein